MASRRFCDICNAQLTPEDDAPFIRILHFHTWSDTPRQIDDVREPDRTATAFVAITNENNHALTDVCNRCKLKIVNDGISKPTPPAVATLQPMVAADIQSPVALFAPPKVLPDTPPPPPPSIKPPLPTPPPITFEHSAPPAEETT